MNQPKITQDNVHLLLPNKIAQLANRLLQNGVANDMATAINIVYSSPVYAKLEQEKTKYWWLGVNALYQEITQSLQKSII
jgi:predicted nucleotide-binding protein